jgi:hypothetical protein
MHITFWLQKSLGKSPPGRCRYRQEDNIIKNVRMNILCNRLNNLKTGTKSWSLLMTNIQVPSHHVNFLIICIICSCSRTQSTVEILHQLVRNHVQSKAEIIVIINKTLPVFPHQICSEKCMNSKQVIIKQLTHTDNNFKCNGSEQTTHLHVFPTLPKYCKSCVGQNWCLHELSATHLL